MFIKVILDSRESVYQCHSVHVERWDFKMIRLDLDDGVSLEFNADLPGKLAIFAMNDSGQTIDTFCKNY